MKKIMHEFGFAILSVIFLLIVSSAIVLIGSDSYKAGKASITPQLEQTNNEFTLKVQQLQLEVIEKQHINDMLQGTVIRLSADKVQLEEQVVLLTQERDEAIASGSSSAEQIAELNNQIDILTSDIADRDFSIGVCNKTIEDNLITINALNTRVSRLAKIIDRTVTEVCAEDLEGITSIGAYTFADCINLTSIEIPEGVTSIGNYAFSNCTSLVSATFPASLSSIYQNSFHSCTLPIIDLRKSTRLSLGIQAFASFGGSTILLPDCLSNLNTQCFNGASITSLDLSNTQIKTIPDYGIYSCKKLETIILPSTLEKISTKGLMLNSALKNINLENCVNLTNIGEEAFSGCSQLQILSMPNNVSVLGSKAFYDCTSLVSINLPASLKILNSYTFYNCKNLETVIFEDGLMLDSWNTTYCFSNCTSLTNLQLKNIIITSNNSLDLSKCTNLTQESILNLVQELHINTTTSTRTLNIGSTNKAKVEGLYVKLIDITDEMRAEDEYIDNKLPFVLCESTDEGAMLINDYVTSKNWILK